MYKTFAEMIAAAEAACAVHKAAMRNEAKYLAAAHEHDF